MEICLQNKNLGKVLLLTSSEALKVQNYSKEFMMIQRKKAVVEDNLSSLTFVVTSSIFFIKKKKIVSNKTCFLSCNECTTN